MLGGVLPTPAVALLALDLGVVMSASHNPPEYNGVKFFDRDGSKLADAARGGDRGAARRAGPGRRAGRARRRRRRSATSTTCSTTSAPTSPACGSRSTARTAPTPGSRRDAFERLGAEVHAIGDDAGRHEHQRRLRRDRPRAPATSSSRAAARPRHRLRRRRRPHARRRRARRARRRRPDRRRSSRSHLGVDLVAVTPMTNLGFHALMAERGIRVAHDGRRRPLRARGARARGRRCLGGEQSGHVIYLDGHVTGDGLAAALLLCGAIGGRAALSEAAAVLPRYPQVQGERPRRAPRADRGGRRRVEHVNAELGERGRVLVRPSGTEPVFRVLVEAETRRRPKSSVLASPRSWNESSAEPAGGRGAPCV